MSTIDSISGSGLRGLGGAAARLTESGEKLSGAALSEGASLEEAAVEVSLASVQAEASVKVLKAANEMGEVVGALLNEKA